MPCTGQSDTDIMVNQMGKNSALFLFVHSLFSNIFIGDNWMINWVYRTLLSFMALAKFTFYN